MKKIEEPNFKVSDVCDLIISHASERNDKNIKNLFNQANPIQWKEQIEFYENTYYERRNQLYNMEEMEEIGGIKVKQMKNVYTYSMNSRREFRAKLYSLVPERCPICDKVWGYDDKNLDHILPQSLFPQFAITPYNLVPTCSTCNDRKNDDYGEEESTGVFNPYFHEVSLPEYMNCDINVSNGVLEVNVFLKPFDDCEIQDENKYKRLKYWFEELYNLDQLYRVSIRTNILKIIDEFARSDIQEDKISEDFLLKYFQKNYSKYRRYNFSDGIVSDEFLIYIMYSSLANKSTKELLTLIKETIISRKAELTYAKAENEF